jgi:dCMP deaminase
MKNVLIAYVPVLHNGYLKLFEDKSLNVDTLYLIGEDIISEISEMDYIKRKDALRSIDSKYMIEAIRSLDLFAHVFMFSDKFADDLILIPEDTKIFMPSEDISHELYKRYLVDVRVEFKQIFLRWHRNNVLEEKSVEVHNTISVSKFEKETMKYAFREGQKSFDWWRQVGSILLRNGYSILVSHNEHTPDAQLPAIVGDPRSIFKKGIHYELSTAEHAEAVLIAEAARLGISTDGLEIFVTDFPCPACAKMIARSGIKKCYFSRGYSVLDGESILKYHDVEIIRVDV